MLRRLFLAVLFMGAAFCSCLEYVFLLHFIADKEKHSIYDRLYSNFRREGKERASCGDEQGAETHLDENQDEELYT